MWEDGELTEQGTLLKDVQTAVHKYLRVHLPRVLSRTVLDRVQTQEELYREFTDLREQQVNKQFWSHDAALPKCVASASTAGKNVPTC